MKLLIRKGNFWKVVLLQWIITLPLLAQQIEIPRIEQMPDLPTPYVMRDWKKVTIEYDKFVFDFNKQGLYLPLIWWRTNTVNYPEHISFGLHTVVGTTVPNSAEAINVLPAVISASLVGIDKSKADGYNYVLMTEEYFNRRPEENIYLNHPVASSGGDWWYDTMPNVFFYQLYNLYPNTGDFQYQFRMVADRWSAAVKAMGGGTTPWTLPNMNYRGWRFSTMTPNTGGVPEPDAAGAIAWILYNAYVETGLDKYRIGAELALEFLNSLNSNPAYELQLPYGVYTAARMNAEMGTNYDIEKMLNWSFEVGPLRSWGAIVGNWGGYDCSGLIGEVNGSNDYAFLMNTLEQIGALVPMIRYDERFARAIGKWVLNAANAVRLFYTEYLPDVNQDSESWAHQYDSLSVIGHEALRKFDPNNPAVSPYATGDAVRGGWGHTNLSLYSSSHVGILGGIIDTTNVKGILRLNVLKTDYFHKPAFPTYLYYNPFSQDTTVALQLPAGSFDLYDAVSNSFLLTGAQGQVDVPLNADNAVLLVLVPANSSPVYHLGKMLVDSVVVDFHSGQPVSNYPPRIKSLAATDEVIALQDSTEIFCTAMDLDGDSLRYTWNSDSGTLKVKGDRVFWHPPSVPGFYQVRSIVDDGRGGRDSATVTMEVVTRINHLPEIRYLKAHPRKVDLGATTDLQVVARDVDGDTLTYQWSTETGNFATGEQVTWTAPDTPGNYLIYCTVSDGQGGMTTDSIWVLVRDFSLFTKGELVAYYPFPGNAEDASGYGHHGSVFGAVAAPDRFGNPNSAYFFDGLNDFIRVAVDSTLNFTSAITINFWVKIDSLYNREAFLLSHGSWQNRWKVSLIPGGKLRWTVKTTQGIKDLDSETLFNTTDWYNITCFYDGADFEIYINGELDNFSSWSGTILPTDIDFLMGQMLPGVSQYNFRGVLDEVRLFNYGLTPPQIEQLYSQPTTVNSDEENRVPQKITLLPNAPNPFNSSTRISFYLPRREHVKLVLYDVNGRRLSTLFEGNTSPGLTKFLWQPQQLASGVYFIQLTAARERIVRKILYVK